MDEARQTADERYQQGAQAGEGIATNLAIRALIATLAALSDNGDALRADILGRAIALLNGMGTDPPDADFVRGLREHGAQALRVMIGPDPVKGTRAH